MSGARSKTKAAPRRADAPKTPPTPPKRRIFILDDHPMMREGLATLVRREPDLEVCGEAESANEALEKIGRLRADLVLADITLPDKSGLEFIKDAQAMHPGISILVISMHDEAIYAERVLRAGGRGYIMKQEGGQRLMAAMRQVLGGRISVSEKMSARLLETFSARSGGGGMDSSPTDGLSDREFEIFQLIGRGLGTREIAGRLHLSVKTVEVHRANIKTKIGVKTAPELIRHAVKWVESQGAG